MTQLFADPGRTPTEIVANCVVLTHLGPAGGNVRRDTTDTFWQMISIAFSLFCTGAIGGKSAVNPTLSSP